MRSGPIDRTPGTPGSDKKTERQKYKSKKTRRQGPKREFYIVMSGQFCTLAMFFYEKGIFFIKRGRFPKNRDPWDQGS